MIFKVSRKTNELIVQQSLRFIPTSSAPSTVDSTSYGQGAPSISTLRDTLREGNGPASISSQLNNRHPLEARVAQWEETQLNMRLENYRRLFGAAEPIRRTMELEIVKNTEFVPSVLERKAASSVHSDILRNKECDVDWEDIYSGAESFKVNDFHSELERKMNI
ncbi:UMP1-domain-containing protein [Nadsonia fulvescens var. elongata DSM 6958]|uniref:UMP1-domain-containing protein n=1 Tax=Nadsonia fulvescens var. elongata DSM 6958 TaxID=857566 RepID=A0A1E3PHV0_9ASCO|nr:UMP1-domain-containing protein [Nadsonia fulvescens var. elongata DSM 6958]